ncbi:spermidine synthase [Fictibacillus aquaticus]|nr:spermidine synthase [Fictibacillus aquaticus]
MSKKTKTESKLWLNSLVAKPQQVKQDSHGNENIMSNGDIWDKKGLREMVNHRHKMLVNEKSKFQDITVLEAVDIRMYLNEQLQFSSLDERIYHQALVHPAFHLSDSRARVLILGGGDGLALREVFKYKEVEEVVLVDIDEKVIQTSQTVPSIVELNNGSLLDKRVNVKIQDAREYVLNGSSKFDVIIVDFPDPAETILARLYAKEMFEKLYNRLTNGGVIVCQSNSPSDAPGVYWTIGKTMESAGFHTKGYHAIVPSFGDWGFHLGQKSKIEIEEDIYLKTRAMPSYEEMFTFSKNVLKEKNKAAVNSEKNLILHHLYEEDMKKWHA